MWSHSSGLPAGGSRCARTLRHLIVTLIQRPHLSDADALSRSSVWGLRNCSSRASQLIFIPLKGPAIPEDPAPASDCSHGCKKKLPSAVAATSCVTLYTPTSLTHPSPRIHSTVSTFLTSYRTSVPLCTVKKISMKSADELRCICAFVISVLKAWLSWRLRCFLMGHNREDNTHGYTWLADTDRK